MAYFFAIDAGGTKAEFALADETRILARFTGETIKRTRTSDEFALRHLESGLEVVSREAGVDLRDVRQTCIGTAGETVPLVTDWLRAQLGRRVGGGLLLLGDVEIALDAAFPGEPGILVMAGTGSNVAGRSAAGKLLGAGGYGPVIADQGSGHRIGTQALRQLFLALDEERSSLLLRAIQEHWKLGTVNDIVAHVNTCAPSEYSGLARVVLACAEAGDAVALKVLQGEGEELAQLALLVHRRLTQLDGAAWQPRFAFTGSILQHAAALRVALVGALRREVPSCTVLDGAVDPIEGALWRARAAR